jgi:hypothetical protein
VVIVLTSGSVARTLLLPGSRVGFLLGKIDQGTDRLFRLIGRLTTSHERRHRYRSVHAPLILAAQLWSWLVLYLVGYALLLWPETGQLAAALKESGSSLLTLGFAATGRGTAVVLDLLAAATGLIVVALQIAYLPTLYSAFNRREADVSLLAVRAGQPAWGPELLARSYLMGAVSELPALYSIWERWAAELAESHSSYPVLLRFRAANPLSSWLTSFLAVLDSAALLASLSTDRPPLEARLFLRMGFGCLQQLAATLGIPFDSDPRPDAGIALTEAEFRQGIDRLQAYNVPLDRPVEEVWIHFQGWRVNYESIVYHLAFEIDAPPALWSGPRRHPTPQVAPQRLLDRTPDDPEGAKPGRSTEAPATKSQPAGPAPVVE